MQLNIFRENKVFNAIKLLQDNEPPEGYYLCFSGGKDSTVIKYLADMAGVKYDAHYNVVSADPPELIRYIKKYHIDVVFDYPERNMWQLIEYNMIPPTRLIRYCCRELKEHGGEGRTKLTGVRWAESKRRRKDRKRVEIQDKCIVVNPIIDWSYQDVWLFIKDNKIPYCCLYNQGYKRIGCIGCPMGGPKKMQKDFARYPEYKKIYLHAFSRAISKRKINGLKCNWVDCNDMYEWWVGLKRA